MVEELLRSTIYNPLTEEKTKWHYQDLCEHTTTVN